MIDQSQQKAFNIETRHLLLRPFQLDDLDLIETVYGDEEILRYTPFDIMTREQATEHLKNIVHDWKISPVRSLEFAMIQKESQEKIGRCHILIDPETDTGMIGWLLRKAYRGNHYARESGEALIQFCFDNLHLHRVNAVCNPNNIASCRTLEQLGMRQEALLRQKCRYVKKGIVSWEDELEYAIYSARISYF